MKHIFAADIGGTNSRFGHFTLDEKDCLVLVEAMWLKTTGAVSFEHLLHDLGRNGFSLLPDASDIAIIAVAGPVEDGTRSRLPLIAWDVDLNAFRDREWGRKSLLINDFVAQAYACLSPVAEDAKMVVSGSPVSGSVRGVIGAGTGLGKALLVHDGKGGYFAVSSEGGHTNFPFLTGPESAYQEFLARKLQEQYSTCNTVVSGRGLSYLHSFLTGRVKEPAEVVKEFSSYPDTLAWAAKFYGRVCRNYVLETLALGGLYVTGGLAARAPQLIEHPAFEEEFRSSDTMAHLLEHIPVYLIGDEISGLWGGAVFAQRILRDAEDA